MKSMDEILADWKIAQTESAQWDFRLYGEPIYTLAEFQRLPWPRIPDDWKDAGGIPDDLPDFRVIGFARYLRAQQRASIRLAAAEPSIRKDCYREVLDAARCLDLILEMYTLGEA